MPLALPAPDKRQLARAPLALVVCQIKFEELLEVADSRKALAFHESLGGRNGLYPRLERLKNQTVNIQGGPMGLQQSVMQPQLGWRFLAAEGDWTVALMPDHVVLETSRYTTWSGDFEHRLGNLLDATAQHISPVLEQRVGLRYVDRITEPLVKEASGWRDYISPAFLGPVLDAPIGDAVRAAQQQIDLDLGDGITSSIRHGFFADPTRDGALTYLLDVDVYREIGQPFDVAGIKAALRTYHERSLQIFQRVVTPRMLDLLDTEHE